MVFKVAHAGSFIDPELSERNLAAAAQEIIGAAPELPEDELVTPADDILELDGFEMDR